MLKLCVLALLMIAIYVIVVKDAIVVLSRTSAVVVPVHYDMRKRNHVIYEDTLKNYKNSGDVMVKKVVVWNPMN